MELLYKYGGINEPSFMLLDLVEIVLRVFIGKVSKCN